MDFKINEIKLDLASYRHYWFGIAGIGKSSTFRDLILKLYNNDPTYGLLIVTGEESGHKALSQLQYQQTTDWSSFLETIDALIDEKEQNHIKIVGIDTVDELIEIATKEVLRMHFVQKKERANSILSAMGGYGAGKRMVIDLIETQVGRLDRAGYSLVFIGHSKFKDLTDKETDNQYQMLTSNLENNYHAIFANKCDIMCVFQMKRNIKDGKLLGEKRMMRFRATLEVDAKSRIAGLPDEVELSADNYIEAVNTALKSLSGLDDKKFEKKKAEEVKQKEESAKEFVKKEVENVYGNFQTPKEYQDAIMAIAKELGSENSAKMKSDLTKAGLPVKFTTIDDMDVLKKIYAIFNRG